MYRGCVVWWSWCPLYWLTCCRQLPSLLLRLCDVFQALTPLCVDSARVLWASFRFRPECATMIQPHFSPHDPPWPSTSLIITPGQYCAHSHFGICALLQSIKGWSMDTVFANPSFFPGENIPGYLPSQARFATCAFYWWKQVIMKNLSTLLSKTHRLHAQRVSFLLIKYARPSTQTKVRLEWCLQKCRPLIRLSQSEVI